jgi:hypothetical protein
MIVKNRGVHGHCQKCQLGSALPGSSTLAGSPIPLPQTPCRPEPREGPLHSQPYHKILQRRSISPEIRPYVPLPASSTTYGFEEALSVLGGMQTSIPRLRKR